MKRPTEPNKKDCCNSGCNPCIYDIYEKQLELYQFYLKHGGCEAHNDSENALSQLECTSFVVVKSVDLCDKHKIIFFRRKLDNKKRLWWKPGHHFLLKYTSDSDFSCTRAYTPLKLEEQDMQYDFAVIVKVYSEGLVSKYLYNLKQDEETLWRGPYGSYELIPNRYERIIMIAQGTGIAPFYSIIDVILNNGDDITKLILYYCCQSLDTILLRNELYSFNSYWNFNYKVYLGHHSVSNNHLSNKHKYQEPIEYCKLSFKDLSDLKPFSKNDQFILCGSPNFMDEYKKILQNENIGSIILL